VPAWIPGPRPIGINVRPAEAKTFPPNVILGPSIVILGPSIVRLSNSSACREILGLDPRIGRPKLRVRLSNSSACREILGSSPRMTGKAGESGNSFLVGCRLRH